MIAAQLVHASGESSPGALPSGTIAVVLEARDEPHLLDVETKLQLADVPHRAIREPDPPHHGALMAIGIVPRPRRSLPKFLSKLPLLR